MKTHRRLVTVLRVLVLGAGALASILVGGLLMTPPAWASSGGGSDGLFSFDPISPSVTSVPGRSAADIFTVSGYPLELKVVLSAASLGLPANADIVGLSSGSEQGVQTILLGFNPIYPKLKLHNPAVLYQFSVDRVAKLSTVNWARIPFAPPPPGVPIQRRVDFDQLFIAYDQASSIFGNIGPTGVFRWNWPMVTREYEGLAGPPTPPPPDPPPPETIDNIDAFKSFGDWPGASPDADENGYLDQGKYVFAVFKNTPGFDSAKVYVIRGTNQQLEAAAWRIYAEQTQLGLQSGDQIDALSVWHDFTCPLTNPSCFDQTPEYAGYPKFGGRSGVVFSLEKGSPTLRPNEVQPGFRFPNEPSHPLYDPFQARIDQGGIFLAVPGPPGPGIIDALPGTYFGIEPGSELDEIFPVDPQTERMCGEDTQGNPVRPREATVLAPSYKEIRVGELVELTVALNDAMRGDPPGGLIRWQVTATVDNGEIKAFLGDLRGPAPGDGRSCASPPIGPIPGLPPCNGRTDTAAGSNFDAVMDWNLCLARLTVKGTRPGIMRVRLSAVALEGESGPFDVIDLHTPDDPTATAYAEAIVRVTPGAPPAEVLPDLVPMRLAQWSVTQRLGGPTLEFGILTANIGGRDWVRPRDPQNPRQWLLGQMYEYALFHERGGQWVEIDRRRTNTICTIDDAVRGNVFPCIQQHGPAFTCGTNQGISRGWATDLFRGLTGQWVFIGNNTGRFKLRATLDPNRDLQRADIPDSSKDGNSNNNVAEAIFTYNGGTSITIGQIILGFDPGAVCP